MATVLIAEDEKDIQLLMQAQLKPYYTVIIVNNGLEALEMIESNYIDFLITDVMMPKMDGFQLIDEIRKEGYTFPILILTAKQTMGDKRTGFRTGADDYLTKPIDYEELLLRIEALARRANISINKQLQIGEVVFDAATYMVKKADKEIELPKKEFDLLFKFLSYPGQVFTRSQLLDEIWGYDSFSSEDTIKTHVSRIRKKFDSFDEFKIVAVKGLGYKGEINKNKK